MSNFNLISVRKEEQLMIYVAKQPNYRKNVGEKYSLGDPNFSDGFGSCQVSILWWQRRSSPLNPFNIDLSTFMCGRTLVFFLFCSSLLLFQAPYDRWRKGEGTYS
jgi:hypothetical protein